MAMLLLHSAVLSVAPGHEFVEACDLVIGDAAKYVGEPGLRIDAIEFGSLDQGIGDCSGVAAAVGAHEEVDDMTVPAWFAVRCR